MGRMSKQKGARGERMWRDKLREWGYEAERGRQYCGGADSPDVKGGIPGTAVEVKFVERLNLRNAMKQAVEDAAKDDIPYVAHKTSRADWLVTVRADDLLEFAARIVASQLEVDRRKGGTGD